MPIFSVHFPPEVFDLVEKRRKKVEPPAKRSPFIAFLVLKGIEKLDEEARSRVRKKSQPEPRRRTPAR